MRVLIIPAAGTGSRLGADVPKALVRVAGRTMLDWLLRLYRPWVEHVVIVVNPAFEQMVRQHLDASVDADGVVYAQQPRPTGMLDAILAGTSAAKAFAPTSVWITWCDQIAVHRQTLERLARCTPSSGNNALVLPTVTQASPYIHLERDPSGRIVRVLHRREGDTMPDVGESDMGLFSLSPSSYFDRLPLYASEVELGGATGERNFLPFIPWLARTESVTTFAAEDPMEAIGINTPQDLAAVEQYLRALSPEP